MKTGESLLPGDSAYRRIVETANGGIGDVAGECRTTFVNQRIAAWLGLLIGERLGENPETCICGEDLAGREHDMAPERCRPKRSHEQPIKKHNGGTLWTMVFRKDSERLGGTASEV